MKLKDVIKKVDELKLITNEPVFFSLNINGHYHCNTKIDYLVSIFNDNGTHTQVEFKKLNKAYDYINQKIKELKKWKLNNQK